MIFSIWDNEIEKKEKQKKWTDNFRKIGEEVYTFFVDTVIEKRYENREGQWDMSCEITDAMKRKQHILVEAGVGIGKTFAYIVPLLFYHKKYGRPIVIATSTIALQEQLESDINVVENIIGYHPEIILVKGQNHFLCRNRADQFFFHNKNKENNKEIYEEIENGGCERNDWDINISDKIWNQINVREFNPVFCRQNCVHKDYCYYYKMRGELRTTNGIILCNQDLLTINLVKRQNWGNEILTDKFEFVVIDEAHNLENKVRSAFTKEMSYNSLSKTMEHIRKISNRIGSMIDEKIKKYYEYLDQVFSELYKQKEEQDMKARKNDREIERYYVNCNIPALSKLKKCVHDISLEVSIQFGVEDSYKTRDVDNGIEELQEQEYFWESMLKGDSEDIFWMNAKGTKEVILSSCPKNVNQLIEQLYFSDSNFTTILTSATITSGSEEDYKDRYKYFSQNTNFPIEKGYISEPKISPFNYDEHALIYYTENMPHPSKERNKFIAQGVEEIKQILEISKGKALILFTAKSDMQEVYEKLKEAVPYKVLVQNAGSSQTDILKEFKRDVNSVLLGTGAYWEGISVEGTALSNLIIFRLPFPVPEPIIDYKIKAADNGLMEVLVPEMIIKLKQGIGRLIRSDKDFGIVSIIDSRVGENSNVLYKSVIWESLPIKNRTSDINEVAEFYKKLAE